MLNKVAFIRSNKLIVIKNNDKPVSQEYPGQKIQLTALKSLRIQGGRQQNYSTAHAYNKQNVNVHGCGCQYNIVMLNIIIQYFTVTFYAMFTLQYTIFYTVVTGANLTQVCIILQYIFLYEYIIDFIFFQLQMS